MSTATTSPGRGEDLARRAGATHEGDGDGDGADASLAAGTSGAIMVVGVFMAMFLVGMLYFVVGLGETILFRERMQDASDAAAFSAAVMHARGMNLIALINIIMAAVLAVLVALRTIELLTIGAIALASALAFVTGGASLSAVPPLAQVQRAVRQVYNSLRPTVDGILRAGHRAGRAVRVGMPFVAQGKAVVIVVGSYRPPAQVGFVYPFNRPLPTEDAPYRVLCNRAADYVAGVALQPLYPVLEIIPGPIQNFITGMVERLADAAAATVCGGSVAPPRIDVDNSRPLPEAPSTRRCLETGDEAACRSAHQETERSQYDPQTGNCVSNEPRGAVVSDCRARIQDAFRECRPGGSRRLSDWVYQTLEYQQTFENRDGRVRASSGAVPVPGARPRVERPVDRPMCGQGGSVSARYDAPPSELCRPSEDDIIDRERLRSRIPVDGSMEVRFRVVVAVLGCKGEGEPLTGTFEPLPSGGNDRSPQQIRSGLLLGDEDFQVRGFVLGDAGGSMERADRGVRAANRWRDDTSASSRTFRTLAQLGRVSVAQAEFYYAGPEDDPEEWTWHMSWRARLRRFRMPRGLGGDTLETACTTTNSMGGGGGCSGSRGLDLGFLERVIVH